MAEYPFGPPTDEARGLVARILQLAAERFGPAHPYKAHHLFALKTEVLKEYITVLEVADIRTEILGEDEL